MEDCAVLGLPFDEAPEQAVKEGIWHQHVEALEAFLDVATQFNRISLADGRIRTLGLDYSNARSAWDLAGLNITPALFAQVQLIERGAIAEWNG
mgnify:CR=1 FL=1